MVNFPSDNRGTGAMCGWSPQLIREQVHEGGDGGTCCTLIPLLLSPVDLGVGMSISTPSLFQLLAVQRSGLGQGQ